MKSKLEGGQLPFFAYGTLLPGQRNFFVWGGAIIAQEQAVLANGRLIDLGSYPMLLEEGEATIQGMLLTVAPAKYMTVLSRLDILEGFDPTRPTEPGYRRVMRQVRGQQGCWHTAWVYIGQGIRRDDLPTIPNGDWASYAAQKWPLFRGASQK